MSMLYKKFVVVLFVVLTIAALLLPAHRLLSQMAGLDTTKPQASEAVAYEPFGTFKLDGGVMPCGYTWAG